MGSFPSVQCRDERRRSNRLSKPPMNKQKSTSNSITSKLPCISSDASDPESPHPATWHNPWTQDSIPISSPDHGSSSNAQRTQSVPSVTFQSEPRRFSSTVNSTVNSRNASIAEQEPEQCLPSPGSRSAASSITRRDSFRPTTLQGSLRSRPSLRQPKRSYSVHSSPRKSSNSAIYETTLEEASSSNTHFKVDSQRFSMSRRRSLLTRPGIATRRSTQKAALRSALPIGQEMDDLFISPTEASALPNSEEAVPSLAPAHFVRPSTPGSDVEYTHLGALKLGSLRVVNGSASPSPSDRIPMNGPRSTKPEPRKSVSKIVVNEADDVIASTASMLEIPTLEPGSTKEKEKEEDVPGSPFSFEKSPTMATREEHLFFTKDAGDEAIFISDDEIILDSGSDHLDQATMEGTSGKRPLNSLSKADSGYSSATSVRSLRKNRSGTQHPNYFKGSSKASDNQALFELSNKLAVQRQLSLQGSRPGFNPHVYSNSLPESNGYPTSPSTMCHDMQQMQLDGRIRSASIATSRSSSCTTSHSHAQLTRFSFPATEAFQKRQAKNSGKSSYRNQNSGAVQGPRQTIKGPGFNGNFDNRSYRNRTRTSSSETMSARRNSTGIAKERGPPLSGRARSKRPDIDAPPLPTFSIPEKVEDIQEGGMGNLVADAARGRTHSRSKERQHQSKRPHRHQGVAKTSSPFIFH